MSLDESWFVGAFAAFRIGVSEFAVFDCGGAVRRAGRWSTPSRRMIDWDEPDDRASQAFGDRWYDQRRSAVLVVSSVLSPFEPSVLINQDHSEFPRIAIGPESPVLLDHRRAAR